MGYGAITEVTFRLRSGQFMPQDLDFGRTWPYSGALAQATELWKRWGQTPSLPLIKENA